MQSGGGGSQHAGARGRSPASAAASPSSSSQSPSGASQHQLGFDSIQHHQQQQHNQLGNRQSLQHQLMRKPEGNESILAFQAAGVQGMMGGTNFGASPSSLQFSQSRKHLEMPHQHGSHLREDGQNKTLVHEQQAMNPVHQAYMHYSQQAAKQKTAMGLQPQGQANFALGGPSSGNDHDIRMANFMQANNHAQAVSSNKSSEPFGRAEKQIEPSQLGNSDQRIDSKPPMMPTTMGHPSGANLMRPGHVPQVQPGIQNSANNQMMAAQLRAWALEHNIDLSQPANANLVAQLVPLMQSRMMAQQKANEGASQLSPVLPGHRQHVTSPPVASESSPRANSSSEVSGQSGPTRARQTFPPGQFGPDSSSGVGNSASNRENQSPSVQPSTLGNGVSTIQSRPSVNLNQGLEHSLNTKGPAVSQEVLQMQYLRQLNQTAPQSASVGADKSSGSHHPSQGQQPSQASQQQSGFTKQQMHVLKAQILAFRRLKKGDGTLPQELLRAITPPPLESQQQTGAPSGSSNQVKSVVRNTDESPKYVSNEKASQAPPSAAIPTNIVKEEASPGDKKTMASTTSMAGGSISMTREASALSYANEDQQSTPVAVKAEQEMENNMQKALNRNDLNTDRGKAIVSQVVVGENAQAKKPQQKDIGSTRKYHGPLFDFPCFTRKPDSLGSTVMGNNNLSLAYDIKDLLSEQGLEVLNNKRAENLRKIGGLLAVNLERKRIRPDLVVRLQIEEKKLKLLDLQARLRDQVDQEQQEIMAMTDREYRKFVRTCERQRMELSRQVQASQKAIREKQLKSIFLWRKKLLEAHWAIRDARTARNRGVAKYHERMLKEFSKRKDDDRNKRMEALKNNDVERYREMLLEQQTNISGDAAERYNVLSTFLTQTEEYLHKLGSKITATKSQQEVQEAASAAAAAARAQGLSEEEVRAAAACAGDEVMIRNQFSEMNAPRDNSSVNKYYSLAHAINERVVRQPSILRAGTLRDYQLVGLQWMLSLYNNKLNGILADEMGLGKTVQVMALIAYLMEYKGNYGPHLIIVPNAVLVNWKSELRTWLPSVSCIYYVGSKDQRSKLFSQEVCAMKFNVLVTTYEFIMFDRSKLSRVDWKYIVIDEAQRMKDRESVLARDLDRYRCQRRLLLTGTPLQNDLKELWSLLNLLLPEVFDNRKAFHDWFAQPFQKEVVHNAEDDWLETEKKVIIIHRLHQILEPFMLRRRVEDVEGSLPPKVSFVLKCKMSALQGAIYDWVKTTGTIRVDPEDEKLKVQRNPYYEARVFRTLNNRCMELRKVCNHPLLSYPYFNDFSKDFLVKSCGKLWILDRILMKLHRSGHRVLLFSTMTKLLDILEEYLQWRRLLYRRIDGTTSLEDRESAIVDFNDPQTDCFIFLLSIRAAGRGLNLQSADTVIIYDPDPNPKNEEQAVARAHRIGQKREVKVIYMEAVVDKIPSHQKEDEFRSGGSVDLEDDLAGKDRYIGSIESLIRNNIQQYKIDMADEVINAGRFDQRTTHEERRMTLETLLHDEERYQETVHDVPSLPQVNRLIARSEEEVELFDQMDEEFDWIEEMTSYDQVPDWLRASTKEVNSTVNSLSKKPSKDIFTSTVDAGPSLPEKRRGRQKGQKNPVYTEVDVDDDNEESSDEGSEDRREDLVPDEDGEVGEYEDEDDDATVVPIKEQTEEDVPISNERYDYPRSAHVVEDPGSPAGSSDSQRMTQPVSPSLSSQKFTTLSAIDARPCSGSKRLADDLEEGEIAVSGDSHLDIQRSGSWNHEREEGEDEQVLQLPKIKGKRSTRLRPRHTMEREERYSNEKPCLQRGDSFQTQSFAETKISSQPKIEPESKLVSDSAAFKQDRSETKTRRGGPSRRTESTSKLHASIKPGRLNSLSNPHDEAGESSRDNWDGNKDIDISANSSYGAKMSDIIQRRCKNALSKVQRRIDKEGSQIVPLLTDLWKKTESSGSGAGNKVLDFRKIDHRIDKLHYNGVMEFVNDVQSMLKSAVQHFGFSHEVRCEARKVHDLFFEVLKMTFPDMDFHEAKNSVSFLGPTSTSTQAPAAVKSAPSQLRKHRLMNDVDREMSTSPRQQSLRAPATVNEDSRTRSHLAMKESKISNSSRDPPHESPRLTHPGDLVVCKKKRKDREKPTVNTRSGSGSAGPVSPPSMGRSIRSPGSVSTPRSGQQVWSNQPAQQGNGSSSGGTMGWANPVKRLRTDAGKRRSSFM
ncbi:ATP-dependent helicase BRM [Silene latifolia]|uniref:ATP-dependent helicase BRM n=1 Tax=Silene latifolia TaxID=37657 RepID=UPI003D771FFF